MNDNIIEYIFEKKSGLRELIMRICIVAGVILIFLLSAVILGKFGWGAYSLLFLFAAGMFGYYLWQYTSVEYEVCIVENSMDIDAIYGRNKRSQMLSLDLSKLEMAVPYKSQAARYYDNNNGMASYVFVSESLENSVLFVIGLGASSIRLYLESDDRMMEYIKKRYSSKVKV